jgi:hypothetical protein
VQVAVLLLILAPPMQLKGLIDLVGTLAITAGIVFMGYALFSLGKVRRLPGAPTGAAWA